MEVSFCRDSGSVGAGLVRRPLTLPIIAAILVERAGDRLAANGGGSATYLYLGTEILMGSAGRRARRCKARERWTGSGQFERAQRCRCALADLPEGSSSVPPRRRCSHAPMATAMRTRLRLALTTLTSSEHIKLSVPRYSRTRN